MKFRYVGQPLANGTRERCKGDGLSMPSTDGRKRFDFRGDDAVEVDDEVLAKRLSTNNHFEAVSDAPLAPPAPAPTKKSGKAATSDARGA